MFQDSMVNLANILKTSGVSPKDIEAWSQEPWSYFNVNKANAWIRDRLQPLVDVYNSTYNRYSTSYWTVLANTNASHPDLKLLAVKTRDIRTEWFKRPRFPDDKGRMEAQGI